MNLQEAFNFLNFWINKETNAWYTIDELTQLVDRAQISLYSDYQGKYGTSQRLRDSLSPFRTSYSFAPASSAGGVITVPTNQNYLDLLDIYITYTDSTGTTRYKEVPVLNEDERSIRLQSQVDPPTATSPIAEVTGKGIFQLWPKTTYTGVVTFLRRPVKPVFSYSLISERVIVYNDGASTNLEWSEKDQIFVLLKALSSVGINLSEQDIMQFAEIKTQQNWAGQNKL